MNNKVIKSLATFVFAIALTAGCASGVKRGVVAMKLSDSQAHVGMGKGEVNVGDHVQLYRNSCSGGGGKSDPGTRVCRKEPMGHGEITQILSDDYSVVQFPAGTKFSEGDTLEKHPH